MPIQEKYQNLHVIYWDLQGQKMMMNLRSCVNMLLKIKNIMLIFLKILKKDLGTNEQMLDIWNACKDYDVFTGDIEERIVAQMLLQNQVIKGLQMYLFICKKWWTQDSYCGLCCI